MAENNNYIKLSNGKVIDYDALKSGLKKSDVDKKFHNLFSVFDFDKNEVLTEEEANLFFSLVNLAADKDKVLSKKEEQQFLQDLGIELGENADLSQFVQMFDKIKESLSGYFPDGSRVIQTTYENGNVETIIFYPDGEFRMSELKKRQVDDSPSPEFISPSTKIITQRKYSDRAKAELQEQSRDWLCNHINDNLKMIRDYQGDKGFLEAPIEAIANLFGKSIDDMQTELVEQRYYANKSDLNVYYDKIGGTFDPSVYQDFLDTESKYNTAKYYKMQSDELNRGIKILKQYVHEDEMRAQGRPVPQRRRSANEVFAEIFNKYCAGNTKLAEQLIAEIAGDITSSSQLDTKTMLAIADKLKQAAEQMYKYVLDGESFENLQNRFQSEYKSLYGKEDYTDALMDKIGTIEGWAGIEKIGIITITQIILAYLTGGASAAAEGAVAGAATGAAASASTGFMARILANQTVKNLIATYGEAKVVNWIEKSTKFLMLTGTIAEDIGLGFLNAASSDNGITWEKSKALLEQGKSSATYIFFGGYIAGPIAGFVGGKVKAAASVSRAFRGGTKVTNGAIQTTRISADKFVSAMQKNAWYDPVNLLSGATSLTTEIGAFALFDMAIGDATVADALKGSSDMQVKLKVMNFVLHSLLGGLLHRTSTKMTAATKVETEIKKALNDASLKQFDIVENKTPQGVIYSIETDGKTILSNKDPGMLVTSLAQYISSHVDMNIMAKLIDEFEAELRAEEKAENLPARDKTSDGPEKTNATKELKIEKASDEDLMEIQKIDLEAFEGRYKIDSDFESYKKDLEAQKVTTYAIKGEDGKVIGYYQFEPVENGELYIHSIGVRADLRKTRTSYNALKQIQTAVMEFAEQQNISKVVLDVDAEKPELVKLYKKFGFEITDETSGTEAGKPYHDYHMEADVKKVVSAMRAETQASQAENSSAGTNSETGTSAKAKRPKKFNTVQKQYIEDARKNPEIAEFVDKIIQDENITEEQAVQILSSKKIKKENLQNYEELAKMAKEEGFDIVRLLESTEEDFNAFIGEENERIQNGQIRLEEPSARIRVTDSPRDLYNQLEALNLYEISSIKNLSKEEALRLSQLLSVFNTDLHNIYMYRYIKAAKELKPENVELAKQYVEINSDSYIDERLSKLFGQIGDNPVKRETASEIMKLIKQHKDYEKSIGAYNYNSLFARNYILDFAVKNVEKASQKENLLHFLNTEAAENFYDNYQLWEDINFILSENIKNTQDVDYFTKIKKHCREKNVRTMLLELPPEIRDLFSEEHIKNLGYQYRSESLRTTAFFNDLKNPEAGKILQTFIKEHPDGMLFSKYGKYFREHVSSEEVPFDTKMAKRMQTLDSILGKDGCEFSGYESLVETYWIKNEAGVTERVEMTSDAEFESAVRALTDEKLNKFYTKEELLRNHHTFEEIVKEEWKYKYFTEKLESGISKEDRAKLEAVLKLSDIKEVQRPIVEFFLNNIECNDINDNRITVKVNGKSYQLSCSVSDVLKGFNSLQDVNAVMSLFDKIANTTNDQLKNTYAQLLKIKDKSLIKPILETSEKHAALLQKIWSNRYSDAEEAKHHSIETLTEYDSTTKNSLDLYNKVFDLLNAKPEFAESYKNVFAYHLRIDFKNADYDKVLKNIEFMSKLSSEELEYLITDMNSSFNETLLNGNYSIEMFDYAKDWVKEHSDAFDTNSDPARSSFLSSEYRLIFEVANMNKMPKNMLNTLLDKASENKLHSLIHTVNKFSFLFSRYKSPESIKEFQRLFEMDGVEIDQILEVCQCKEENIKTAVDYCEKLIKTGFPKEYIGTISKFVTNENITLTDKLCFDKDFPKEHIAKIIAQVNEKNAALAEKLCFDKDFPKEHIANIIERVNEKNAALAERLCFDKDFPKEHIAYIIERVNDKNAALAERLCFDKDFPKEHIANIILLVNEKNAALAERLCFDKDFPKEHIAKIISRVNKKNAALTERLCFDKDFPKEHIANIIEQVYEKNAALAERLCFDKDFPKEHIAYIIERVNEKNAAWAERLCFDKDFPKEHIAKIISRVNEKNAALTEKLCFDKDFPKEHIANIIERVNSKNAAFADRLFSDDIKNFSKEQKAKIWELSSQLEIKDFDKYINDVYYAVQRKCSIKTACAYVRYGNVLKNMEIRENIMKYKKIIKQHGIDSDEDAIDKMLTTKESSANGQYDGGIIAVGLDGVNELLKITDMATIENATQLKFTGFKNFLIYASLLSKLPPENHAKLKEVLAKFPYPEQKVQKIQIVTGLIGNISEAELTELINQIEDPAMTAEQKAATQRIFSPNNKKPYAEKVEEFIEEFKVPESKAANLRAWLLSAKLDTKFVKVKQRSIEDQLKDIDNKISNIERIIAEKNISGDSLIKMQKQIETLKAQKEELEKQRDMRANSDNNLEAQEKLNDKQMQELENRVRDFINYPNQSKTFIDNTLKLLYAKMGIQNPSQELLDAINYDFKYFARLFAGLDNSGWHGSKGYTFRTEFTKLINLISDNPGKKLTEARMTIQENQITRQMFAENGLDFDFWNKFDNNFKHKFVTIIKREDAIAGVLKNLKDEFESDLFKGFEEKERNQLLDKIKAAVDAMEKTNDAAEDNLREANTILRVVATEFQGNEYWKQNAEMFSDHIEDHRKKVHDAQDIKDREISLFVRLSDSDDVGRNIFFGDHVGCCTSSGGGNGFAAAQHLQNAFVRGYELVDENGISYGNSMCFFAKVDGKLTFVIDSFEANGQLASSKDVPAALIKFAHMVCAREGQPDAQIMFGPNYNHIDKSMFKLTGDRTIEIIGAAPGYTYIDSMGGFNEIGQPLKTAMLEIIE